MIFWFFFIIISIGVCFAIALYVYDNTQFSKLTGISYFRLLTDAKVRNTYKIISYLHKYLGEQKVLFNILLPSNDEIDIVSISEKGVYLLNIYHFTGWIYGKEANSMWAEALHREHINKFNNPIIETNKGIEQLKGLLPEVNPEFFKSVVIFSNSCSFKEIEVQSKNVEVLKVNELKAFLKDENDQRVSKEIMTNIYNNLASYSEKQIQIK